MILKNLLWDYFGKFSSALMQLVTSFVLMRLLNVSDFGLIGMTLAVNGIATTFTNFGFSSYIVQQKEEDSELQSTIFWFNSILGLILCSIIIFFSQTIANFYKLPTLKPIVIICSFFLPFSMLLSIPNALLGKRLEFKKLNLRNVIIALISAVIGITAAYLGLGVWSLVLQQGLNLLLNLIISYQLVKWKPNFVFNKLKFIGAFNFGKYIFMATLVESIYSRLDVFTVGKLFSINLVGFYTRAQSLSSNIIQLSSKSILNVLFPTLIPIKNNKDEVRKKYYNFLHHICFAFCLLSASCFLFAQPAFVTFFKPKWAYAAVLFKIIIISSLVYPISELMLSIIESRGNSKAYFIADVWKKVVLYPVYIVLFFYNLEVFLYVNFFGLIAALFINLFFLDKEIEIGYKKTCLIFVRYFLPTIALSFLLDKIFVTNTSWSFAALKALTMLSVFFISTKFYPTPTSQLILNKLKK